MEFGQYYFNAIRKNKNIYSKGPMGVEPMTYRTAACCSTTELRTRFAIIRRDLIEYKYNCQGFFLRKGLQKKNPKIGWKD